VHCGERLVAQYVANRSREFFRGQYGSRQTLTGSVIGDSRGNSRLIEAHWYCDKRDAGRKCLEHRVDAGTRDTDTCS
jgi:hypothetical protein